MKPIIGKSYKIYVFEQSFRESKVLIGTCKKELEVFGKISFWLFELERGVIKLVYENEILEEIE